MGVALRKAGGGCRVSGISACNIGSGDSGDLPLPSQTDIGYQDLEFRPTSGAGLNLIAWPDTPAKFYSFSKI